MSITKAQEDSLQNLIREMSARTLLFHQTVAETLGVNATDLKCIDVAALANRNVTAGELAEISGLTTGAVTGVIDRLEQANLVRRVQDPKDRRRVIIKLTHARDHELHEIFIPLQQKLQKLWQQFSPAELRAIARFIEASNSLAYEHTRELRTALAKKSK